MSVDPRIVHKGYRPTGGEQARRGARADEVARFDPVLLGSVVALLVIGLVMVGSASINMADRDTGFPFHYLVRQGLFIGLGISVAWLALSTPLEHWQRMAAPLLIGGYVLLVLVLPLGREVNGATRWLPLGPFNLQVAEVFKVGLFLFMADFLSRRRHEVQTTVHGFLKPLLLLAVAGLLLLMQPDFGTTVVLAATVFGVLFLAGVRLWLFAALSLGVAAIAALLVVVAPYRMQRLTAFLNPWADPYDSGFQLTQALIAFGRGEWVGVGLGSSIQKLFYLPEAHTDFVFAVIGEELGLLGSVVVVGLFALVVARGLLIARTAHVAERFFAAYLAYAVTLGFALQSFVNLGVNMGVLPTKGLTLPLISYGGSSMIITCLLLALLLRVDHENRFSQRHWLGRKP
ncbi:MAG: putative lipid II flippase FtsW [Pseudomonadota bacterium]